MSGVVHFKFKSSNSYDSVGFDGAFISVSELKVLIAEKKGLSKDATSELLLSDPRTQSEYSDDAAVIPKSSSVLVRRVPNLPSAQLQQQQPAAEASQASNSKAIIKVNEAPASDTAAGGEDDFGGDLYSEQQEEDAALTQLLNQAGQNWEKEVKSSTARGRGRGRGREMLGRGFGRGRGREAEPIVLPKGYICYRCGQQGHHISDCPTNADPDFKRIRPAVGVPSVLLTKDKGGGLLLPDGTTGSLQPNEDAFLKETIGMPGAKTATQTKGSAGQATDANESDSKAIVVHSEAGPALAGGGDLALPTSMEGPGLLLPPNAGSMPWEGGGLPPFLPGMALPGMGLSGDQPLSKEEFLRMKEELRRKHDGSHRRSTSRSRSRSRSRHSDRRRRGRDSRSPRRRDSRSPRRSYRHRRHHSRDRSHSRERRPYFPARRRSPSPGFIQLRKRSRSPVPRRYRQPSPDFLQLRQRDSASPPRRRSRHADTGRWNPDDAEGEPAPVGKVISPAAVPELAGIEPHFGNSFDARPEDSRPASRPGLLGKASSRGAVGAAFKVPELLGDAGPSYYDQPADEQPTTRQRQESRVGAAERDLKPRLGIRSHKREALEEAGPAPKLEEERKAERASDGRAFSPEGSKANDSGEDNLVTASKHGPLPKTFSIPVEPTVKEKKKKSRKAKEKGKEKSKKASKHGRDAESPVKLRSDSHGTPERQPEADTGPQQITQTEALKKASQPVHSQEVHGGQEKTREPNAQLVQPPERASERKTHGPLFLKAMTDASGSKKPLAPSTKPQGDTRSPKLSPGSPQRDAEEQRDDGHVEGEDRHKRKKEHKHKSKKRHKEKHAKDSK